MATEKRLIPDGEEKVTLGELLPGTIFAFGDDCIAVKGEYICSNGLIEAFIVDSGEQFWGGAKTAKEQNALMVQPLVIEEVEVVEVVHGKWIEVQLTRRTKSYKCSVCGHWEDVKHPYCNCGAKMDGERKDNENNT